MYKSGEFVSRYVRTEDGERVPDKQIQPNAVELTLDKVYRLDGYCVLKDDEYSKANRTELELIEGKEYVDNSSITLVDVHDSNINLNSEENSEHTIEVENPHYVLHKGGFVITFNEKLKVPEDFVGFTYPRSRVIRNSNHLFSALWDTGYEGKGEGGFHTNCMTILEKDMRIAQFMLSRCESYGQYDGTHQGEFESGTE